MIARDAGSYNDLCRGSQKDPINMGLDSVELLLHVEETFDIQISDERSERIRTVQQLQDCVLQLAEEQNAAVLDNLETMNKLVDIVVMQLGVKREMVTPATRFIEDLQIDRAICPSFGRRRQ